MTRRYGLPYQGSKNAIAEDIVGILPPANTFYDLFVGGGAITDCALSSGKYKQFVINDIKPMYPKFFVDALNGWKVLNGWKTSKYLVVIIETCQ